MEKRKPKGYWTKDRCINVAHLCFSRSEFKSKYNQAWNLCRQKGWMKEACSHMVNKSKPKGYWQDYNICFEAAKQCITASEFERRFPQAYRVAIIKGWRNDYSWFQSGRDLFALKETKWTKETCLEESKKYNNRSDFKKGSAGAYQKALRNGWIDDYVWLEKGLDIYGTPDCVYKYEFTEFHTVYVGRTINKRERHYAHIFNKEKDVVAKFAHEHRIPVPEMEIIADNLTLSQGQELEGVWRDYYVEQGYYVLNKARTGKNKGSIGSIGWGKWNYESCFNEAKKYKTRKEFQIGNVSAYTRALQYNWFEDYYWFDNAHTGQVKWNEERCFREAQKYCYIEDYRSNSRVAYEKSRKKGWLINYVWLDHKPKRKRIPQSVLMWTKERCYEEATKYKTRSEFQYAQGSNSAYKISVKNGWINDYYWMLPKDKPNGYWDEYNHCYEEARKYKTHSEFQYAKGASCAYKSAVKNGWIEDYYWMPLAQKPSGYWTEERCREESKKYATRIEFRNNSPSAYAIAQRKGWLTGFVWLAPPKTRDKWNYETCKAEASKYEKRGRFKKGCSPAYYKSHKMGWIDEFFPIC